MAVQEQINQHIINQFDVLRSSIESRPLYVMFEELLHCNYKTDHEKPKSVLPVFNQFISAAEKTLLEKPIEEIKVSIVHLLSQELQSVDKQKLELTRSNGQYVKMLQDASLIEKQLQQSLNQNLEYNAVNHQKFMTKIQSLRQLLFSKDSKISEKYQNLFNPDMETADDLRKFQGKLDILDTEKEKQDQKIDVLKQQLKEINSQTLKIFQEKDQATKEKMQATEKCNSLEETVKVLKDELKQIDVLKQLLKDNSDESNKIKENLQQKETELAGFEGKRLEEEEKLNEQITELDAKNDELTKQAEDTAILLQQKEDTIKKLEADKQELFQKQDSTYTQLLEAKVSLQQFQEKIKSYDQSAQNFEQEKKSIQDQMKQLEEENQKLKSRPIVPNANDQLNDQLKQQVVKLQKQVSVLIAQQRDRIDSASRNRDATTNKQPDDNNTDTDASLSPSIDNNAKPNDNNSNENNDASKPLSQSTTIVSKTPRKLPAINNAVSSSPTTLPADQKPPTKKTGNRSRISKEDTVNSSMRDKTDEIVSNANQAATGKQPTSRDARDIKPNDNNVKRDTSKKTNQQPPANDQIHNSPSEPQPSSQINQTSPQPARSNLSDENEEGNESEFRPVSPLRKELGEIQKQIFDEQQKFQSIITQNMRMEAKGKKVLSEQLLDSVALQQRLVEKFKGQLKLITQQDYQCIDMAEKAIVEYLQHKTSFTQTEEIEVKDERILGEQEESDQLSPKDLQKLQQSPELNNKEQQARKMMVEQQNKVAALKIANDILDKYGLQKINQDVVQSADDVILQLNQRRSEVHQFIGQKSILFKKYERESIFQTLNDATQKMAASSMMIISTTDFKKSYTLVGMQLIKSQVEQSQTQSQRMTTNSVATSRKTNINQQLPARLEQLVLMNQKVQGEKEPGRKSVFQVQGSQNQLRLSMGSLTTKAE